MTNSIVKITPNVNLVIQSTPKHHQNGKCNVTSITARLLNKLPVCFTSLFVHAFQGTNYKYFNHSNLS